MKFLLKLGLLANLTIAPSLSAAPLDEGSITLHIERGEQAKQIRYLIKGDQLRIEYLGKHIPLKPYNLIDLKSGDLQIVRPINRSWLPIPSEDLIVRKQPTFPEQPAPPAGIGAHPSMPGTPGLVNGNKSAAIPNPAFPKPNLPPGITLPEGIGPQPDGGKTPAHSASPPVPGLPGGGGGMPMMPRPVKEAALTASEETKMLHGYLCRRYLLSLPGEGEMTLWLSDAEDLPSFFLPLHEAPHLHGRTNWSEQWPAFLREKNLFPMLAILRTPSSKSAPQGREICRWQVEAISTDPIADPSLFSTPKDYHQAHTPRF